jgi:acyl carrier protein
VPDNMYDTVAAILVDSLGVPADEVGPDATLEELDADSLVIAEFVVIAEEQLGVAFPQDLPLNSSSTLKEVAELLQDIVDGGTAQP